MADDVLAWLRGVHERVEATAAAATPGPWRWIGEPWEYDDNLPTPPEARDKWGHAGPDLVSDSERGDGAVVTSYGYDADNVIVKRANAEHIALHDPAAVLARVEAERAILAQFARAIKDDEQDTERGWVLAGIVGALGLTVAHLASGWRTQPGWRDYWAPESPDVTRGVS